MHAVVGCPADDVILAFVDGTLPPAQVQDVKQHLGACEGCRELVAEVAKGQFRSDLLPAGVRVGRYEIRRVVGSGGMGVVYEAHDPTLNRRVALKLIKSGATDERGDQRLLGEAEAMAQLQHPNVIAVYDVGTFGDQIFVAMELIDGVTLSEWMTGAHSIGEILDAFVQAGRGLVAAHKAGLVHRDFKPDNVLVDRAGRVRVGDFGLARSTPASLEAPSPTHEPLTTATGALVGTPAYMAPEQLSGGAVDARTDQFCFCVALYEALYGRRPFAATSFAALKAEVTGGARVAPPRRGLPAGVRRAIVRGLSVSPDDRFATLAELLGKLSARPPLLQRVSIVALPLLALVCTAALLRLHAQRLRSADEEMAPSNAQAAAAWADGLAAMRARDPARARDRFARAVELAPDHALSRASLAEVWKQLGYDDEAEAEAKRARAATPPPSREGRLLLQGRCAVAEGQPAEAAKAFAALYAFRPEDVEYGLELAQADIDDGRPKEADAVVAKLRRLPAPSSGPDLRIGTMAAFVKEALGELDASRAIAADVAAQARARHDKDSEKEALFDEAIALFRLGHMKEALAIADGLARDARSDVPVQQAMVEALLGNIYLAQDRLDEAEHHFREDLRISRQLGSHLEVSTMLENLGTIAAARGDHAAEVAVLEDSIPLIRARGNQRDLVMALSSLTDSLTKVGALQKALAPCDESRDLARAMHDRAADGYANLQCAKLHEALGELEEAKRRMTEAVAGARQAGDKDILVSVLLSACTLYRTRGDSDEARRLLDEARALSASTGHDSRYIELYTAELDIDDQRLAQAEERLQPIVDAGKAPFQSVALAYVARAELARKRYAQAVDAIERAEKDPSVAHDNDRRIQLLGLAAAAYAATGSPRLAEVTRQIDELTQAAKAEGNIEALLGLRLALAESDRFRQPPRGRRELAALADEAEHRGFLLLSRRARAAVR